ncbi:MAG: hypothetical protein WC538_04610 [Thermoanaerobaculia bacterium]|jgi:hypothetical protein
MPSLNWMLFIELPLIAILVWLLAKVHAAGLLSDLVNGRRASSRIVGRGELIDGSRHIPVALALSDSTFFYENDDMKASLGLQYIREVGYESESSSGSSVEGGKILRFRCLSQMFEFLIRDDEVARWEAVLPARRDEELVAATPA